MVLNKNTFQTLLSDLNSDDISKQVADLKALIFDAPETSEAKIEFFKDEIASGRYEIQPHQIAEQMILHHVITESVE